MQALNRRDFLQGLALAGVATPWMMSLSAMAEAAVPANDYKALVCVFLNGGNDQGNMLVPMDAANYAAYQSIRSDLARPLSSLIPLASTQGLPSGLQFGLANDMPGLAALFAQKKAAIQLNVGPLIQPTSQTHYQRKLVPLPPKLYSHNDQQSVWQSAGAEGAVHGWGGEIADSGVMLNGSNTLFSSVSLTGNSVFLAGNRASQYQLSTNGALPIWPAKSDWMFGSSAPGKLLHQLITEPRSHVLENELNLITRRSMDAESRLSQAFVAAGKPATGFTTGNSLAEQLAMVAQMIKARTQLGLKRQVFMVSLGGFDLHDSLLAKHGPLLAKVDQALSQFYAATVDMGVADQVMTFTASEFGRTMTSNGDGSDHGWGSHHFLLGGGVQGGRYFGTAPLIDPVTQRMALGTAEDAGQGRLIPSTSVDQLAATLARWFGVAESNIPTLAPNLSHFGQQDMGYFVPG